MYSQRWSFEPSRSAVIVCLAGLLLATSPATVVAHEDAVLTTAHSTARGGDSLQLAGRKFGEGMEYALKLVGPLREYQLGAVRADSAGRFMSLVAIPRETLPGFYKVTATADDGDVVASVHLTVMSSPGMSETHGMPSGQVAVGRDRSVIEWITIGLLIAGSVSIGLWSLRRAGRAPTSASAGNPTGIRDTA